MDLSNKGNLELKHFVVSDFCRGIWDLAVALRLIAGPVNR